MKLRICRIKLRYWVQLTMQFSTQLLYHAFMSSRIDYCNAVLAESPKAPQTSCNGCSTPRLVSSPKHRSTTADWLTFCTTNFIGSVCRSGSSSRSAPWCFVACVTQFHVTCPDFCTPVANVAARSQLRSARRHLVVVPCYNIIQPPRLLCSWSDDLELSNRQSAWSIVVHWQFSSPAQNISVW